MITTDLNTYTKKQAEAWQYRSLTIAYLLPHERDMLDIILHDMRMANRDILLVRVETDRGKEGVEVWVKG